MNATTEIVPSVLYLCRPGYRDSLSLKQCQPAGVT